MKTKPESTTQSLLAHLHRYYSGKDYYIVIQKEEDYLDMSCDEFEMVLPDHIYHMVIKKRTERNGRIYSNQKKYFELPESVYKKLKKKLGFKGYEYIESLSKFLVDIQYPLA